MLFPKTSCINALKGATLISTVINEGKFPKVEEYQCPERGDPHFYETTAPETEAPSRDCVNALKGATLISTKRKGGDRI